MKPMSLLLATALVTVPVLGFVPTANATETVVYSNDFEGGPGGGWTNGKSSTTPSGRKFLGEYGPETATLSLSNLAPHSKLELTVKAFIIRSWDGIGNQCCGPDTWTIKSGTSTLFSTTFSLTPANFQNYPEQVGGGFHLGYEGATEKKKLGYTFDGLAMDAVFTITVTFDHTASTASLKFIGAAMDGILNESWGIDDLTIKTLTGPPNVPSIPSGPSQLGKKESGSFSTSATDADGHSVKYRFDWGDASAACVTSLVSSGTTASCSHSWTAPGTYCVKAKAEDSTAEASAWSACRNVTVNNQPPNAAAVPAGPAQRNTTQSGTYSTSATDPTGDQVKYRFNWGDQTTECVTTAVNSGTSKSCLHSWASAGSFCVKARAEDVDGAFGAWSSCLTVSVTNQAPTVPAKPGGPAQRNTTQAGTYSASATDPTGQKVKYIFAWGDGTSNCVTTLFNSGVTGTCSHAWANPGSYCVKAKAEDETGAASAWSPCLTVGVVDPHPTTPALPTGPSARNTKQQGTYSTSSTDANGNQIKYTFEWDDDTSDCVTAFFNSGATASCSHTWTTAGTYCVRAKAEDSTGLASGWSPCLLVTVTNQPPGVPTKPVGPTEIGTEEVDSYSTSSTDPTEDDLRYVFNWNEGTECVTPWGNSGFSGTCAHAWPSTGNYCVRAKAEDIGGAKSAWSPCLWVAVVNRPPAVPGAPSGPGLGFTNASYDYAALSTDPTGDDLLYRFDWGDGSSICETPLGPSGESQSCGHAWTTVGSYCVKAQAVDARGAASEWGPCRTVEVEDALLCPDVPAQEVELCFQPKNVVMESVLTAVDAPLESKVAGHLDEYRFKLPTGTTVTGACVSLVVFGLPNACTLAGGEFVRRIGTLVDEAGPRLKTYDLASLRVCTAELHAHALFVGVDQAGVYAPC